MNEIKNPTISVVIATFNSARTIEKALASLKIQDYPPSKINVIISDGGSTDGTIKIANKYHAQIVYPPKNKQSAEYNKAYGLQFAKGAFILCIDHDNIVPHKNWLQKMVVPLLENKKVVAVEPLRYHYQKNMTLLDRYFALFGVNDPLPYYLGKADRMDYINKNYNLLGTATDKGDYYLVKFDKAFPRRIPTLGANGFLIRRSLFLMSKHTPGKYFHIDINVDLVAKGYNLYAFIKDDIIHLTNSHFFNFLSRRKHFLKEYYYKNNQARRYSVFYKEDSLKLILFIIYSVTLIRPILDSIRGYIKIHDPAWFIHPFMCLAFVSIYTTSSIKGLVQK